MYGSVMRFRQMSKQLYSHMLEPLQKKYDMSRIQLDILLFFANNPQYDTAAQMVALRKLSKSQVSVAVSQLATRGYLRRLKDDANRRVMRLQLTETAAAVVDSAREIQRRFSEALVRGVSEEEAAVFGRVLERVLDNIKEAEKAF